VTPDPGGDLMQPDPNPTPVAPEPAGASPRLREVTTDALRYWEIRRIVYSVLLAAIVVGHFLAAWPASAATITFNGVLGLFVLAVLANVAYSAVYIVDVFVQLSGFRASRAYWRWIVLLVGFAFAAVLTHFISSGMFPGGKD
jgi:hypothetical protein